MVEGVGGGGLRGTVRGAVGGAGAPSASVRGARRAAPRRRSRATMLSGFKSFYSKSVDLIKQVQDTVVVGKGQPGGPAPTVEPEDTHPGFHLVDRWRRAACAAYGLAACRERCRSAPSVFRDCSHGAPLEQVRADVGGGGAERLGPVEKSRGESPRRAGRAGLAGCPYMYSIRAYSMRAGTHRGCATAQAQDAGVKRFADRCAESQANWGVLQAELAALDGTHKAVASVRADMESMCAALKVLDEALDAHVQAKEERDMYKWKAGIEQKTAEFEAGRQADLAQMERNLKAEQVRQEKLKKAEEDRILREIEARERREAALQAEAARKGEGANVAPPPQPSPPRLVPPPVLCCASCAPPCQRAYNCTWPP